MFKHVQLALFRIPSDSATMHLLARVFVSPRLVRCIRSLSPHGYVNMRSLQMCSSARVPTSVHLTFLFSLRMSEISIKFARKQFLHDVLPLSSRRAYNTCVHGRWETRKELVWQDLCSHRLSTSATASQNSCQTPCALTVR